MKLLTCLFELALSKGMLYENEVGLKEVFWSFSIESEDVNPIDKASFSES